MIKLRRGSVISLLLILIFLFASIQGVREGELREFLSSPTPSPTITLTPVVPSVLPQAAERVKVIKVIDGDTIQLEDGRRLRYIGIDTPETVDPRRGVQCFGKEASEKNKELILNKEVRLEKDISETDRFGRLLRYVYVDDVMINEQLVNDGYAQASSYPPDVKYQERFDKAERLAREEGKGLWGSCLTQSEPS